jgi:hypothetical protein
MEKITKPTSKHLLPSEEYWEITGVNYGGKIQTYNVYAKMTVPMSQDKLAEFSRIEKEKGNPYAIGLPRFIAICEAGINSKDADLIKNFQKGLKEYPQFLSKVIYNPSPLADEIIHEYGMPDEYSLTGDIIGEDGWIREINNKKSLELLTEVKDIKKLNKFSQEINQTPMFLWRFNSKPLERFGRAVRFIASDGRFVLGAYWGSHGGYPAFRVLLVD